MKSPSLLISELSIDGLNRLNGLNDSPTPPPPRCTMEQYLEFIYDCMQIMPIERREFQNQVTMKIKSKMVPFRFK